MGLDRGELPDGTLRPRPEAIAELGRIRRRELQSLSDRLARVDRRPRSRLWNGAGVVLVSAALGALFAGIPLLSSTAEWDEWVKPVYGASVFVAFLLGAICFSAARGMSEERAESVGDIETDLDRLLAAYEVPDGQDEPISAAEMERINQGLIRDSLRQIRVEARANREMLERADQQGQYWKVTEGGPETKKWKDNEPCCAASASWNRC